MSGPAHDGAATEALWAKRDRRVPAVAAAHAFTGLPAAMLEQASRISFAASAEFEALLTAMGAMVRELPSVLVGDSQRCVHEVRGPVIWSETIAARGNSFGDDDVFVCSTVRRSYDCVENQLLCWLLQRAGLAIKASRSAMGVHLDPGERRRIEESAAEARRWRAVPRLRGVTPRRPTHRETARLRSPLRDNANTTLLVDALGRAQQPFSGSDVRALCDAATLRGHARFLSEVRMRAGDDYLVRCPNGAITAGGIAWSHAGAAQRSES